MITGALGPDSGSVRVFGMDPAVDGEAVRLRCGVVSAKPALYDRLSGWNNLRYAAELYGLGRKADDRIFECAERFGIEGALDQQVGGFSTGMKTRLALTRSILHEPDLLLYDEPTSGLDPESAYAVLDLIRQMTAGGRTVIMCTHLLAEAEGLADRIVVLEHGTAVLAGTHEELAQRYWPEAMVRIVTEDPSDVALLRDAPGVLGIAGEGTAEVRLDDPARVPELVQLLVQKGARVLRVDPHRPTLEDVYFAVRQERRDLAARAAGAPPPPPPPSSTPSAPTATAAATEEVAS
jgi:ABC-2 type transport system ATP-binding protein